MRKGMAPCLAALALLSLLVLSVGSTRAQAAYIALDPVNGYAAGDDPRGICVGDFDRDGDADIATANAYGSSVSIYLNNGDGSFTDKVDYPAGGECYGIATGDLDRDGKLDLAVANYEGDVAVFTGNGDGTFATKTSYPAGSGARSIVIVDLDNDSYPDLAVADSDIDAVSVLINCGDGTFAGKVDYAVGSAPRTLLGLDYNNDNRRDLVVVNNSSSSFSLLRGKGDGTFYPKTDVATGDSPRSIAAGDFNEDGKADFVTANVWSNNFSVFLGNGDGTFAPKADYDIQLGNSLVVADFNDDGHQDIALTGGDYSDFNNVYIAFYINQGDGSFVTANDVALNDGGAFSMTAGDFDGDGHADLATGNFNDTMTAFIRVYDKTPPTSSFLPTAKPQGSYVRGLIKLPARSADARLGLQQMELFDGTTRLRTVCTEAMTCCYSFPIDTRTLKGGKHTFRLTAGDRNDNSSTISRYYFIDNLKPRTIAPYKVSVKRYARANLYYKVTDAFSPTTKVTIKIKNSRGVVVKTLSLGNRTTNKLFYYSYIASLAKGTYRFYVYATDKAGNGQGNVANNFLVIR